MVFRPENYAQIKDLEGFLDPYFTILPDTARKKYPNMDFRFRTSQTGFRKTTLDTCAAENKGGAKWRCFPVPANSIVEVASALSVDLGSYLGSERVFTYPDTESTMVLINFQGLCGDMHWYAQNGKMRGGIRAKERHVFVAALLFLNMKGETLLPDWEHWGLAEIHPGARLAVGKMASGSIKFSHHDQTRYSPNWRVCVQKEEEELPV